MADTKITALTADTSPSADDLIVTVNDPSGTPANRKVTLGTLLTVKCVEFVPIGYANDGAAPPAPVGVIISTNKVAVRKFDSSTDEDVFFEWAVPADLSGSTVTFRVITWVTESTAPSAEGWAFFLQGASLGDGDALGATLGTAVKSSITGRSDAQYDRVATAWSSAVTITNLAAGETVILKLYRDVSDDDDTYAQDVGISGIEIKCTKALSYT